MSLSSQFVAKYGKPTTDKTTAGKVKTTTGGASGKFLNAVKTNAIKPVQAQAAPPTPIAEPSLFNKTKTKISEGVKKAVPVVKDFLFGTQAAPATQDVEVNKQVINIKNDINQKLVLAEKELADFYKKTPLIKRISRIIPGDQKQKEFELSRKVTNYRKAIKDVDEFLGNDRANKGLVGKLIQNVKDPVSTFMPFYKDIETVYDTKSVITALDKYERGETLDADEQSQIDMFRAKAYNEYVKNGLGDQVADVITGIPKFGLEMLITKGLATPLKPTISALEKVALTKISNKVAAKVAAKVVTNSVQLAVQGSLNFPAISARTAEYMLPTTNIEKELGTGDILKELKPGDKTEDALKKGYATNLVDYVSEGIGDYIDDAAPFIKKAFLSKWIKNKGLDDAAPSVIKKILKQIHFSSVVPEVIEEEVGYPIQTLIDKEEYNDPFFTPEGRERLLVEVLGIGAFGGMANVSDNTLKMVTNRKQETGVKDVVDLPTDDNIKDEEEVTLKEIVAEEEKAPTKITEEQTKASSPAEEKLITRIQTQIESGNDTFVANLRERVIDNPKLTKDLESAIAKAEARIAALEQKPEVKEEKAQKVEKEEIKTPKLEDVENILTVNSDGNLNKGNNIVLTEKIKTSDNALILKEELVDRLIKINQEIKNIGGKENASANQLLQLANTKKSIKAIDKLIEQLPSANKQAKTPGKDITTNKATSPKAVEQTKKKEVVVKTTQKQEQKPKYTEEQVGRAEVAKQTREMFSKSELKNIADIKRLMNLKRFAEGDIETLRRVRPVEISDLVEAVRRIENNPDLDDDAALIIALGIPNAAQTKPGYYAANKDALYMAINAIEDSGERHVTNDQALAIIRKYFTAKELPVEFVDNIRTRDGGEAWGRYAQNLVSFVNGTTESAPTHEAVHAYLDLFTTPFQKEAYIARTLSDARKTMKRTELNSQIRETQLQAGGKIGIVAAARIWAEEKMANDFIDYVKGNNKKSVLRRFFDRVIRFTRSVIDRNNVENLYQDIINKRRDVIRDVLKPQQDYFQEKLDRFKVTTKTLSTMKKELSKDMVSRQAIESYTKRQGITKPDIELIQETLKDFPGDKINVAEFIASVQAKIMPVALIRSSTYADYGTGHLTSLLANNEVNPPGYGGFKNENIMETHIWDTPFRHGQVGHFGADYGQKKVSYEIREVTEPQSGNKVYVVVESGVVLNQENINEAVASTSETREAAEQWIKDHTRDLEVKKSGLLGHTRVASTKTKEVIVKSYEDRIRNAEIEIKNREEELKTSKKLSAFLNKHKKKIAQRLTTQVNKMVNSVYKEEIDNGRSPGNFAGFSLSYIFDRFNDHHNPNKDWGFGVGDYQHYRLLDKFVEEVILKGYNIPKSNVNLSVFVEQLDYLYNPKKPITQKIVASVVKRIINTNNILEDIVYRQDRLRGMKNDFHLAITNFQEKPAIRHLLEVQSDPFQSHYALETDYTKARDEVKRLEKILAASKETLETFTRQSGENYPPGEKERLKKIEELKNTVINDEADLNLAKRDLEKAEAARSGIEKQFMAVGSKYHERAIKEEIRLAAHDLLSDQVIDAKFRIPTPLTIAFIEGYTDTYEYEVQNGSLVKRGTKQEDILKAQMREEMPKPPIDPNDVLEDGQILIPFTDDLKGDIRYTGDHISIDGELWVVDEISEDDDALVIRRESDDYVLNEFDGDTDSKEVGDAITYLGSDYIVLAVDGSTLTIGQSDRVHDDNVDDTIQDSVDGRMDEVVYELKNLEPEYGKIDTAEKAQKVLDDKGEDSFDNYETGLVLKEMAEEDPDKTDLDPYDYMERARESAWESENEYIGEVSYWEDLGYTNVAFYENGGYTRVIYTEDDAEVINVEAPDSEYVIEPQATLDTDTFNDLQGQARERIIPTDEDYKKAVEEYDKKVAEIKEKYAKLEEELKNKPIPAATNRDGEYLFNPETTFAENDEYLTVYKYYEREVLPFFRKFRKDAKLITDENGQQWWETTITKNDQEPVEVYMRKSSFDSLNEMADQLVKSQKIVTKTAKAARKPIDIEGLKKKSKAYTRIVDQLDSLFREEVSYDQMTIARDAANALEFVTQHPDRALRIAKGLELPPQDITETAISIAMADKARESGDYGQWSELERLRSLRQTRRGQEIVSERGRVTENSPEYFLDKVLQERKSIIMAKKGWVYEKKSGKKGVTISEGIKQEVETAKAKVNNRIMNNLESAQDILNRLTCKY